MIVTFSGASGAGKTTVAGGVLNGLPEAKMIISDTTRSPRDSDLPGEYDYRSTGEFEKISGSCLWTLDIHGNHYGTREESVAEAKAHPDEVFIMLLTPNTIDILKAYIAKIGIKTVSVYIMSPQEDELRRRLWKRANEDLSAKLKNDLMAVIAIAKTIGDDLIKSPEELINEVLDKHAERFRVAYDDIEERIKSCKSWDEKAEKSDHYEYRVRNDGLIEETVEKVFEIIKQNQS